MKKKQKNDELNFLYMDNKENIEKKSDKKKKDKKKNSSSKKTKDDKFNLDKEIVIGIPKQMPPSKKNTKEQKKNQKKKNNKKDSRKLNKKENIKKGHVVKWVFLIILLICAVVVFLMSPVFNIVGVDVIGYEQIPMDTIVSLSNIQIGENIFKYSKRDIKNKIKENQYIDSVKIKRKLPNIIEISVKERKTTFIVEYNNTYAYINNQGYILELTTTKKEVPIIVGCLTKEEDLKVGSRLIEDDLNRLGVILRIMESANSNSIDSYITKIDITDSQNYTLLFETKGKIAYIGSGNNINDRMRYLKVILEKEEGIEGEIFVNGDLTKDKVYFREKI